MRRTEKASRQLPHDAATRAPTTADWTPVAPTRADDGMYVPATIAATASTIVSASAGIARISAGAWFGPQILAISCGSWPIHPCHARQPATAHIGVATTAIPAGTRLTTRRP
jgi:hypothetical protein